MNSKNIDTYLENHSLKSEFKIRNLDLDQIWQPTPDDLELENQQLRHLLDWVEKYEESRDRKKMEQQGYLYPPLSFDIDPDSDWLRFERWMAGKSIRGKLRNFLPKNVKVRNADDLTDDEVMVELEKLIEALAKLHFSVDLKDDLPPRLIYEDVMDMLEDEFDLVVGGWWHLDGCTGYCPDCLQRPWCEQGCSSCWNEDKEAGYMVFPDAAKKYVSPSPASLEILRACQDEEDRKMKKYMEKHAGEMNPF